MPAPAVNPSDCQLPLVSVIVPAPLVFPNVTWVLEMAGPAAHGPLIVSLPPCAGSVDAMEVSLFTCVDTPVKVLVDPFVPLIATGDRFTVARFSVVRTSPACKVTVAPLIAAIVQYGFTPVGLKVVPVVLELVADPTKIHSP